MRWDEISPQHRRTGQARRRAFEDQSVPDESRPMFGTQKRTRVNHRQTGVSKRWRGRAASKGSLSPAAVRTGIDASGKPPGRHRRR